MKDNYILQGSIGLVLDTTTYFCPQNVTSVMAFSVEASEIKIVCQRATKNIGSNFILLSKYVYTIIIQIC